MTDQNKNDEEIMHEQKDPPKKYPQEAPDPRMAEGVYAGPAMMVYAGPAMMVYGGPDYFRNRNANGAGIFGIPIAGNAAPKFCPECGTELYKDANFCHNCGVKIKKDEESAT